MGKPVLSRKTRPRSKRDILFLKRSQGSRFFPSRSSFVYFYCLQFFFFLNSVRTPSVHWVTTFQSLSQRHIKWYSSFFLLCFVVFRFLIWNSMLFFQILFLYSPPLCARSCVCFQYLFFDFYFWLGWVCCYTQAFSRALSRGCSLAVIHRLLMVASLVAEHGLYLCKLSSWSSGLESTGLAVEMHGLRYPAAYGVFLYLLHMGSSQTRGRISVPCIVRWMHS